ncbi:MAG: hisC1 [Spirochaetes bacterium]|nr:MAG: hisC1 [Spirochaetota bacterium]
MNQNQYMKIDANEGRCVLDEGQLARILSPEVARRYPSSLVLEEELAKYFGVSSAKVIATAGADDAIDRAFRALAGSGGSVCSTVPGFVEFLDAATRTGAAFVPVPRGQTFPLEEFIASIGRNKPQIAIIASPDNPWGTRLSETEFLAILEASQAAGTVFILDLTYADFAPLDNLLALALESPGVLVTGSFSKSRGLAGFRAGWAMGGEKSLSLVERLREAGPPYSLSSPAIEAARLALAESQERYAAFVGEITWERETLSAILACLGYETWPQSGNFVTIKAQDARTFASRLKEKGILVRMWPNSPMAEDLVRLTCPGDRSEFTRLAEALETMEAAQ